jgi:protein phosphatase
MVHSAGRSDPGCVRSNNEDYFLLIPERGLYLVADGMGGAQAGEKASQMATETVCEFVQNSQASGDEVLVGALAEANRRVLTAASSDEKLEGMGTTLVALLDAGQEAFIASVGDSRAYVHFNGQLAAVTQDQTWVNEVGKRLGLTDGQLKSHPMRHVLTMAVGVSDHLRVNTYRIPLNPGMQILLSTDGLHGVVPEERIAEILSSPKALQEKADQLIETARQAGGPDNITVALLSISE